MGVNQSSFMDSSQLRDQSPNMVSSQNLQGLGKQDSYPQNLHLHVLIDEQRRRHKAKQLVQNCMEAIQNVQKPQKPGANSLKQRSSIAQEKQLLKQQQAINANQKGAQLS